MRNSTSTHSPRRCDASLAIASRVSSSGWISACRSATVQPSRPLGEVEDAEHRTGPGDPSAPQIPGPEAAAAVVEREIDADAAGALVADAPPPALAVERVERGGGEHQRRRSSRAARPSWRSRAATRQDAARPARRRRPSPRLRAARAPRRNGRHLVRGQAQDARRAAAPRARRRRVRFGEGFRQRPDAAEATCAGAVDQHRLRETIVRLGGEHALEHAPRLPRPERPASAASSRSASRVARMSTSCAAAWSARSRSKRRCWTVSATTPTMASASTIAAALGAQRQSASGRKASERRARPPGATTRASRQACRPRGRSLRAPRAAVRARRRICRVSTRHRRSQIPSR